MSQAAAAQATQATPNLYMVTIKNLDGTTKTVLKSQPLQGEISCYELTPDLNWTLANFVKKLILP